MQPPPPTHPQYLAQHPLFEQPGFDELRADFGLPSFCPPSGVSRVNIWCGSAGTVTPLHFDSYEGILAQARTARAMGAAAPCALLPHQQPRCHRQLTSVYPRSHPQVCGFKYIRFYEASQSPLLYRTTKPWSQQRRWAPSADEPQEDQAAGPARALLLPLLSALRRFPPHSTLP